MPRPDHPSASLPILGRQGELCRLRELLDRRGPILAAIHGPRGRGKTALLRSALHRERVLHFQAAELTTADLLDDFEGAAEAVLGEVPTPRRPGVLPFPSEGGWLSVLMGLVDRLEEAGERLILVLDGLEALLDARRRLSAELGEMVQAARSRNLPLLLILTTRSRKALEPLTGPEGALGPADLELEIRPLPFRLAGWAHGGTDPRDAFVRWALLGDHPAHIPPVPPDEPLAETVLSRVLGPGGDLFEAPLRRLVATFQKPARYASILRALSRGPLDWSGIRERAGGIESGGQLAPYLRRLEEEGLLRTMLPLDAKPGSRRTRYTVADPFLAFWFGCVLPYRSLLSTMGARTVWDRYISPRLGPHLQSSMEEASRRWLGDHAEESLGSAAREAGALWGENGDFPVAGRLANGQVCYGMVEWERREGSLAREMERRMKEARYGIGREARAPLFFLGSPAEEELRRTVARAPLGRIVDLAELMGGRPVQRSDCRPSGPDPPRR